MKQKINLFIALSLPIQILLVKLLSRFPNQVEKYYSRGLYPYLSETERALLGWIPFSIGDFLYLIAGIGLIRWLYLRFQQRFKNPMKSAIDLLSILSIAYFSFHLFWGMNYYRLPLHQNLQLKTTYTTEELQKATEYLIHKTNEKQLLITGSSDSIVPYGLNRHKLHHSSSQSIDLLSDNHPHLNIKFNSLKSSLFSLPLTYMGFSGYLNPWTNEAHYNRKLPAFRQPVTMTHEIAHQLGYAKENEANFIAVIGTTSHPDPYFKYSGYAFAMQHCLYDLQRRNPEEAKRLAKQIHPGVRKNFAEAHDFWEKYENPMEPFFKLFYGNYLKANNQPEGMQSYSYVVALLVNHYHSK